MKTVGLITEYNPFHNGHLYHIEKAKEMTGADRVIVIMSGDFVQRGAPALLSKHLRADMALKSGASVVIELPVCYACGSAEFFASGSVSLLHQLGCVDTLCFGSECGDLEQLKKIAHILVSESESYHILLGVELKKGLSFPSARCQALKNLTGDASCSRILGNPNNILGIEYLKALERCHSSIEPYTLKRESSGYHDTELQGNSSSASAIRNFLMQPHTSQASGNISAHSDYQIYQMLKEQMPENCLDILRSAWAHSCPVEADDFSLLLKYRLLLEDRKSLCKYQDVSSELANRIIKNRNQFRSFQQFCNLLKTKELTYSRISRSLLHILLSITKEDMLMYQQSFCGYARILGFCKDHSDILRQLKQHSSVPVITKLGQTDGFSPESLHMLEQTIFASDLYESVISDKFDTPFTNEYQKQLIRI